MLFRVKEKRQHFVTLCLSHGFCPAGLLESHFFGGDVLAAGIVLFWNTSHSLGHRRASSRILNELNQRSNTGPKEFTV